MRLLYMVGKGMDDPTLASVPLHIAANGSLEVGQDVSVVLASFTRTPTHGSGSARCSSSPTSRVKIGARPSQL